MEQVMYCHEAWLAKRREHITGTDLAGILLPPADRPQWSNPLKVYLSKVEPQDESSNMAMTMGRKFERPILEVYEETTGVRLHYADSFDLVVCPDFPLLGASLDARWLEDDQRPVDAKNIRRKTEGWGEADTDSFPLYYQTQLAAQMICTDTPNADLAVLFSGQDFVRYTLHRDHDVDAIIKEKAAAWWQKHIISGVMPVMDGSESASAYLKKKFAKATEKTVLATPEVLEWIKRRKEADARAKEAESEKDEAENLLRAYMGDASAIPGLLTWRNNKDKVSLNSEAYAAELERRLLKAGISGTEIKTIRAAHTVTIPGPRVLRFASTD